MKSLHFWAVSLLGIILAVSLSACAATRQSAKHPTAHRKPSRPRTDDARITSIDPSSVAQNSTPTINVYGVNFHDEVWVVIDDNFLKTTYVSPTQIQALLTTKETGAAGAKTVCVHDGHTGDFICGPTLTVKPAR